MGVRMFVTVSDMSCPHMLSGSVGKQPHGPVWTNEI